MKPKTFRYNDIITFFEEARTPLSDKQKAVIAERVRAEVNEMHEYREKSKVISDRKAVERIKKRMLRKEKRLGSKQSSVKQ
jgi:hypothetical protein